MLETVEQAFNLGIRRERLARERPIVRISVLDSPASWRRRGRSPAGVIELAAR